MLAVEKRETEPQSEADGRFTRATADGARLGPFESEPMPADLLRPRPDGTLAGARNPHELRTLVRSLGRMGSQRGLDSKRIRMHVSAYGSSRIPTLTSRSRSVTSRRSNSAATSALLVRSNS